MVEVSVQNVHKLQIKGKPTCINIDVCYQEKILVIFSNSSDTTTNLSLYFLTLCPNLNFKVEAINTLSLSSEPTSVTPRRQE